MIKVALTDLAKSHVQIEIYDGRDGSAGQVRVPVPYGWKIAQHSPDSLWLASTDRQMTLAVSARIEADGKPWLHLSISGKDHLPDYETLAWAKRVFIRREKKAVHVFPPESEHVSIHDFCLHLFHCLDGDPLPDFRVRGGI